MTKKSQNFEMWSGDYKQISASVSGSDNGAYDLTGASIIWILSEEPSSASILRKTTDDDISISTSIFTVTIAASDTTGLSGTYHHEAQGKDSSGKIATLLVGSIKIHTDVIP